MRVLVIAHNDVYGTGERARNLIKNLSEEFKITYVTPPHEENKRLPRRIRVEELSNAKIFNFIERNSLALTEDYDIIHTFKPLFTSSMAGVVAKVFRGKPFLLDWDDLENSLGYGREYGIVKRQMIDFSESVIPKFADAITTVSPMLQKMTSRFADTYVIPNGVDVDEFKPGVRSDVRKRYGVDGNLVVFTGVLGKSTDADFAIKAMRYVDGAKLIIVGDGPKRKILERLSRQLKVEDRIIWAGMQPKTEIPKFLSAADVAVMPIKKNLQNEARHPIKLGEYLAAGLPVVTNRVGAASRIVKHGENGMFAKEDPKSFGQAINKILSDKSLKRRLAKNARAAAVQKLDWRKIAPQLEEIYKSMQ